MSFIVRSIKRNDIEKLMALASQFTLLTLPSDRRVLEGKIQNSIQSFSKKSPKEEAEYLFVVENTENQDLCGASAIVAKHGTSTTPTYSFTVKKKERFSQSLGIGFIHQVLKLRIETDGPTEVGGLVVDRFYRGRPERLGKMVSLCRFAYMGLRPDAFESTTMAEMAPPLTEEGRSEFWESLGRRFTGMPYDEADALSKQNKDFIQDLFPAEEIYLCLLDSKARLVLGGVGESTQPALKMLQQQGFQYRNEVDPFDGGPHYAIATKDIEVIRRGQKRIVKNKNCEKFEPGALVAVVRDNEFFSTISSYAIVGDDLVLPEITRRNLQIQENDEVYLSALMKES